jgi:serine/threonine protein kinase
MASVSARLASGSTLGRFRILGLIGRGGMGEVYVAEEGDRRVALKVLAAAAGITRESEQRFERERELLARVSHPGVVRALGALEIDGASGLAYFPMELVLGKSLADLLQEHGRFTVVEAVRVLAQVAAALEATHAAGIVHRDVKPSNVLIARGGSVRLTDFGLARALDSSRFTATGSALGTPAYMSPEQCSGKEAGPATDLYALGCVAHELLAGSPPFKAEAPLALLKLHAEARPGPLREARPEVPERLEKLVQRLLEKDPGARGANPRAELEALHAELTGGDADFVKKVTASIDRDTVAVAALARTPEVPRASRAPWALVPLVALGAYFLRPPEAPRAVEVPRVVEPAAVVVLKNNARIPGSVVAADSRSITILGADSVALTISLSELRSIESRR